MIFVLNSIVDFTEQFYAANIPTEKWDTIVDQLSRFQYVEETCLNHCCWVKLDLATQDGAVAVRRTEETVEKINRLIERYKR